MPWKLFKHDIRIFSDKNFKPEIITEVSFAPEIDSNLEVDGNVYNVCSIDHKRKLVGVNHIEFNEEFEEEYGDDFVCPYCNYVKHDHFELEADSGETICLNCGSLIGYSKVYKVEYITIPRKQNEPIKVEE